MYSCLQETFGMLKPKVLILEHFAKNHSADFTSTLHPHLNYVKTTISLKRTTTIPAPCCHAPLPLSGSMASAPYTLVQYPPASHQPKHHPPPASRASNPASQLSSAATPSLSAPRPSPTSLHSFSCTKSQPSSPFSASRLLSTTSIGSRHGSPRALW